MINGIRKLSLIDYPGKISFVIFLGGCNFNCPYCHNKSIVYQKAKEYEIPNVLDMLEERKKLLEGVVITGGEPTIYGRKLINLIIQVKNLGYVVKLDTNGSNPELLKELIKQNLLDYIAMDIKSSFENYEEVANTKVDINKLLESIKIIESSNIDYEFRTTIYKEIHNQSEIEKIMSYLKKPNKLVLQPYRYSEEQIQDKEFTAYSDEEMEKLKEKNNILIRI